MPVKPDELVGSLLQNPLLAYRVAKRLEETSLVGPWEPASGIENSYERTYCRRHVSGHIVGVVCKTVSAAVWWTLASPLQHAATLSAARTEVDRVLTADNWTLSTRGYTSPWTQELDAEFRRSEDGLRLARVWGFDTGKFEIFEFAFSNYRTSIIRDTHTREEARMEADRILVEQGWSL